MPTRSRAVPQVTFGLHPSFAQAQRVCTRPPYEVTETGWGEFDITITVRYLRRGPQGVAMRRDHTCGALTHAAVAVLFCVRCNSTHRLTWCPRRRAGRWSWCTA